MRKLKRCVISREMAGEPVSCESRYRFERPVFLKQVRCTCYDLKLLRLLQLISAFPTIEQLYGHRPILVLLRLPSRALRSPR